MKAYRIAGTDANLKAGLDAGKKRQDQRQLDSLVAERDAEDRELRRILSDEQAVKERAAQIREGIVNTYEAQIRSRQKITFAQWFSRKVLRINPPTVNGSIEPREGLLVGFSNMLGTDIFGVEAEETIEGRINYGWAVKLRLPPNYHLPHTIRGLRESTVYVYRVAANITTGQRVEERWCRIDPDAEDGSSPVFFEAKLKQLEGENDLTWEQKTRPDAEELLHILSILTKAEEAVISPE